MVAVRKTHYAALCSLIASIVAAGCGGPTQSASTAASPMQQGMPDMSAPLLAAPSPDPRVGLKAGLQDAGEAIWNVRKVSHTPAPQGFAGITNSDLAFHGTNVIQGNYNGFQIWDVSNPAAPRLRESTLCPASQSDVSVYKNLLFVSAEAPTARLDCGKDAPREVVSRDRIRGLRIFDITDIDHPKYLANVQTCRGSHTHTVVDDPKDKDNVYVYISGTSGIRPSEELARCNDNPWDPNNSNFRIEVIKIPLAHPDQAAVVSSPAIFADPTNGVANALLYPTAHAASPLDTANNRRRAEFDSARVRLAPVQPTAADTARCIAEIDALAKSHDVNLAAGRGGGRGGLPGGGCGRPAGGGRGGRGGGRGGAADSLPVTHEDTARVEFNRAVSGLTKLSATSSKADTTSYRSQVNDLAKKYGVASPFAPRTLTQCHDITAYPSVGLAGGACAGMGLLLDIRDTPHPTRKAEVADSNFSFWHSATFSNDGSMVLFSDEWGGGGAAYCRAGDPKNWGADAIFRIIDGKMVFQSYYKLSAPQTSLENCVAHNGSLIPIPGRTIMVQAWYQGGSVDLRVDRSQASARAGVLRPWAERFDAHGRRRLLVGVLVQRPYLWIGNAARPRRVRPDAERRHLPERDRRGEDGASGFPERAGPAEVRLAGVVRPVALLHRPARAVEGAERGQGVRGANGVVRRRGGERRCAPRRADRARDAGPGIHERIDRPAARAVALDVDQRFGEGQLIGLR